nr:reverse transcriptase domain-containing protein [Tanacetum cinerariifolium]
MHRTMMIKEGNDNEEETRLNLDLLTERREAVSIREARYKMKMEQYYNKRVCLMSFKVGPLPKASGKVRFVIVVVDYFTKWIEDKPLAKMTGNEVKKFMWDNIVCRYGLSKIIVTENRTNFIHDPFKSWCKKLNITQINTAVAHRQANDLVERANRSLLEGIKTQLGRERKGWMDELPNVLWAHRTSLKTSNGETPYSLTFGSKAVIPTEIGMPMHRTMMIKEGNDNEEETRLNLDL